MKTSYPDPVVIPAIFLQQYTTPIQYQYQHNIIIVYYIILGLESGTSILLYRHLKANHEIQGTILYILFLVQTRGEIPQ